MKAFIDTETCGLCGPPIIIQYAFDDGPINIHHFWKETIGDSLDLIKLLMEHTIVGFNIAFDSFQICKFYTMLNLYIERGGSVHDYPEDHIEKFAELEADARFGPCLKPKSVIDLMLTARKTKYQITMNRGDIRIRRVPTALATHLATELEEQIVLKNILFARRKDKYAPKWKVYHCTKVIGKNVVDDPAFKDVVLKFKPSVALKALAIDALGVHDDQILRFSDVEVDRAFIPNELGYAPFATAVRDFKFTKKSQASKNGKRIWKHRNAPWRWAWPDVIHKHISHWQYHEPARLYANKDIEYTRALYKYFECPPDGDDDSVLAWMVGAVRWKGFSVDIPGLIKLKEAALEKIRTTPTAPKAVRHYLGEVMAPSEQEMLRDGTGKNLLEKLANWKNIPCPICSDESDSSCECCKGTGRYTHSVADRARAVLEARFATKEIELYDKLLLAKRFHASFKVLGAMSSRMSGTDGLNPQGVKRDTDVRRNFTFSDEGSCLVGGDFDRFEVVIAESAYKDPTLHAALIKKAICPGCKGSGKSKGQVCKDCKGEGKTEQKLHGLFGMELRPGMTYEQVIASKGTKDDVYDLGKRGVFSQIYMGDENTLVRNLNIPIEVATRASKGFKLRFPGLAREQQKVKDQFGSMRQPGGIGTKVEWHTPKDYQESLLGFRRYFTLENMICESLYKLANNPPKAWRQIGSRIKVQRRDREQTASGALASALYSAAFQIQAANVRAAGNHVIQSTGAQITKHVQRRIWDVQPAGIGPWVAQSCNIHDEILCVTTDEFKKTIESTVNAAVESYRHLIPLLKMEWKDMNNWGDK